MPTESIAVTGGAGYIGSHVVHALIDRGYSPVVIDDLSTGLEARIPGVPLLQADLSDAAEARTIASFLTEHEVQSVLHFAAKQQVAESVADPLNYYRHNVTGTQNILEACEQAGVKKFVFSSTAAVYGSPSEPVVDEGSATVPINPYGNSKLAGEWLCGDVARAYGITISILRYFNVVGTRSRELRDVGASNLLPIVLENLVAGAEVQVFGADYPTPDGTCVRDYVHVVDIADAHIAAMRALVDGEPGQASVYNIGTGRGTSVLELIALVETITGRQVHTHPAERRPGDPASLSANVDQIRRDLGWFANLTISDAVESAWSALAKS